MPDSGELIRQTFLIIPLLLTEAVMGYRFMRLFLKPKEPGIFKAPGVIYAAVYFPVTLTLFIILVNTNPLYDLIWILTRAAVILIMQRFIFEKETYKQLFCLSCLLAGIYLARMIIIFTNIYVFELYIPVFLLLADKLKPAGNNDLKVLSDTVSFVFLESAACVYFLILRVYFKQLDKRLLRKKQAMSRKESLFLILPCITCIFIVLVLRRMLMPDLQEYTRPIYELRPALKMWIPFICILLLTTIVACAALYQQMLDYREEAGFKLALENQLKRLKAEVSDIEKVYSDIRALRHDMKNHISNIVAYVNASGVSLPELQSYIDRLSDALDGLGFSYNTGNPISDIILQQKSHSARLKNIEFESDFFFPDNSSFADAFDIGIILDNALDNAIEAAEKAYKESGKGRVYIRSYIRKNRFFIEVQNNYTGQLRLKEKDGLPCSSKDGALHGIGLLNIQNCARKYLGEMDISLSEEGGEKIFTLLVMI